MSAFRKYPYGAEYHWSSSASTVDSITKAFPSVANGLKLHEIKNMKLNLKKHNILTQQRANHKKVQ